MDHTFKWALVLVLGAAPISLAAKGRPASTPEQAVKKLLAAHKAGDQESYLALMGEPNGGFMRMMAELGRLEERFESLLDQKFEKDPDVPRPLSAEEQLKMVHNLQIIRPTPRTKKRVELTVWITQKEPQGKDVIREQKWLAVKDVEGWKLLLPVPKGEPKKTSKTGPDGKKVVVYVETSAAAGPDAEEIAYFKKMLPKWKAAFSRTSRDVRDGKLKTRKAAERAMSDAMEALSKANPPPKKDDDD